MRDYSKMDRLAPRWNLADNKLSAELSEWAEWGYQRFLRGEQNQSSDFGPYVVGSRNEPVTIDFLTMTCRLGPVTRVLERVPRWFCEKKELPLDEAWKVEDAFKEHKAGKNVDQRCWHCFGDGMTTFLDFRTMTTSCGSKHRCQTRAHNEFLVRREE